MSKLNPSQLGQNSAAERSPLFFDVAGSREKARSAGRPRFGRSTFGLVRKLTRIRPGSFGDRFLRAHLWQITLALSLISPIGMMLVCASMLLDLRKDSWDRAEQTSSNLLQVMARDIERNVDIIDLSLKRMIENLHRPGISKAPAEFRQALLFDKISASPDIGTMFIVDAEGQIIAKNDSTLTSQTFRDRDYFTVHEHDDSRGVYISGPLFSRVSGEPVVVISRRITNADGSFGGIVASTLKISYFTRLFHNLNLDPHDSVSISHLDGWLIRTEPPRKPGAPFSKLDPDILQRYRTLTRGRYTEASSLDATLRHTTFARLGPLPLVLDVGIALDSIEGEWRSKAQVIGLITFCLCALTMALSLTLSRELRRRIHAEADVRRVNAELKKLAATDALTDLANRRRFDQAIDREWREARRSGNALSLLVIDADQFKAYNDRYGHQAGDEILKAIARSIETETTRPRDVPARIGGEEFAVILPSTDLKGAQTVAERIRQGIQAQARLHQDTAAGVVTISCGIATTEEEDVQSHRDLIRRADERLYSAKSSGRNRICPAESVN